MNSFKLKISTPDGNAFVGDVVKLDVRGIEGELAIMAKHMPFLTAVKAGDIRLLLPDGDERTAELDGGLLNVNNDDVTLLAVGCRWK